MQESQLTHHQVAVFCGLRHAVRRHRTHAEDLNDLLEEENDREEGRAHLIAHCRCVGFCLLSSLVLLLALEQQYLLSHFLRDIADVNCDGRPAYIRLLLDLDGKKFIGQHLAPSRGLPLALLLV